MCLKNEGLRDKIALSQKLIVRNSRIYAFGTAKWCVITDIFGTTLLTIRTNVRPLFLSKFNVFNNHYPSDNFTTEFQGKLIREARRAKI